MRLPNLSAADLEQLIPGLAVTGTNSEGGQKIVFESSYQGTPCALKAMLISAEALGSETDSNYSDDAAILRARREVETLGDVDNPNLVSLGPVPMQEFKIHGERILVFSEEWIGGGSLSDAINSGSLLPITEVLKMARCVSSAICSLWQNSKIHRDIKPGNIMRREDGSGYVLLDMGMAFDVGDTSITPSGFVVGTPPYYSPEQVIHRKNRRIDFRSDFYSLGIVIYEALTGSHPYAVAGDSADDIITKLLEGPVPPPPSDSRTGIGSEVDDLVRRLLQPRPYQRFRTCAQVEELISEIESSIQLSVD